MLLRCGPRMQARGLLAINTCRCRSSIRTLTTGKEGEDKGAKDKDSTDGAMDMLTAMLENSHSNSKSAGSTKVSPKISSTGAFKTEEGDNEDDGAINLLASMLDEDKKLSNASKRSPSKASNEEQDILETAIFSKKADVEGGQDFLSDLLSGKVEKEKIEPDSIFKTLDVPSKNRFISPTARKLKKYASEDEDGWVPDWNKIAKEQHNQIPKPERPKPKPRPELVEGVSSDAEEVEGDLDEKEKVWLQNLMSKVTIAVERNPTYNKTQRETMINSFRQIDTKNKKTEA
ncbi:hypothetical protein SARC_07112 [Sphaeroforma arctica JP610]|uniref:Uncharacterized protein n=1 Tax=Sphaeroforma arctica JP610 TaxID=667725 RepID=A0A0L0FUL1_9EUKA|nr:hypothetical protein SARC_07112 [Sphaeroforma arctica JP610]KNC80540.1 hypothetical protein SARC_07112 [Sphaeroforma arctica JP610]|eukprot:XP_014154442.1 hypothetical protein SARC_07112 [Sphaeroforma arctica JP610]